MPESYPYIVSNNKIEPIFSRVRSAAKPERFTIRETLHKWGFTTTNDRAIIGILKDLGFLNEGGVPTQYYDRLRDPTDWRYVLAERMKELYADLFAIDGNIQKASEAEIRGAISRVTGKDDDSVKRYYATFKTLASLANFDERSTRAGAPEGSLSKLQEQAKKSDSDERQEAEHPRRRPDFHYNIQIHLPVTTDIAVYNAIFRSLKDNLGI